MKPGTRGLQRPPTARGSSGADRQRGVRPPKKNHTVLLAAGGGGLLLILIVGVAIGMSGKNDKPKANGKNSGGSNKETGDKGSNNTTTTYTPPDEDWRSQPRSQTVPKLQAEIKEKIQAFPADLTALSEADLRTLFDAWSDLLSRQGEDAYSGYPPKVRRDDNQTIQSWRGKVIDERRRREELPKE